MKLYMTERSAKKTAEHSRLFYILCQNIELSLVLIFVIHLK